jgi:Gpi18-like mannosyltransferase
MYFTKFGHHFKLVALTILTTLLFWLIFYLNIPGKIGFNQVSLETIFANYDGPNYMVIAKCGYNKDCIGPNFSLPLPLEYYPAHFPAYPTLIKIFNNFTTGPKAMIFSTLLGSIFLSLILFELLKLFTKPQKAFWLSTVFLFFPARFFILRQVGAPETWFLATTLASIFFFKKDKFWLSAIFAGAAQAFKSPGVLLLASYGIIAIYDLIKGKNFGQVFKKYFPFILVPITILLTFYLYKLQTGNFFAYFHSGDNFHLNKLPYLVFISTKSWINTIWLEDIIYIFLIAIYGVYRLIKKYKFDIITVYSLVFLIATLLVAHRDISRYIAPIYPFLLLAYKKPLNKKPVKIILLLLIPAIILYAINFVCGNTAPISDWTNYL